MLGYDDISGWLKTFTEKNVAEFGDNLLFIGLQGSYGRGEATDKSDIDMVIVFKILDIDTLCRYKNVADSMPFAEKICGFYVELKLSKIGLNTTFPNFIMIPARFMESWKIFYA